MLQAGKIKQKYLATKERFERKFDEQTGRLRSVSVFKDVNNDGKEDLYKVMVYSKNADGSVWERTVIDEDGDGYNDYQIDRLYKNGNKLKEKESIIEQMDSVKNREHTENEVYNRLMTTHLNQAYKEK